MNAHVPEASFGNLSALSLSDMGNKILWALYLCDTNGTIFSLKARQITHHTSPMFSEEREVTH